MDAEFWGAVIPAGKTLRVDVASDEEYIHVSQVALGASIKDARARTTLTLAIADDAEASGVREGRRHTLCTLTPGQCEQVGLDVVLDASFVLRADGANDVHVSGWRQTNEGIDEEEEARVMEELAMEMSDDELDSDDYEDEDEGSDESDDDDESESESKSEEASYDEGDDDDISSSESDSQEEFITGDVDLNNLPDDDELFGDD